MRRLVPLAAVLAATVVATAAASSQHDPRSPFARPDLERVGLTQSGRQLVLSFRTYSRLHSANYMCVELFGPGRSRELVCAQHARRPGRYVLGLWRRRGGRVVPSGMVAAAVQRPDARSLTARFTPAAVGLREGETVQWRAVSGPNGRSCPVWPHPSSDCADLLPNRGTIRLEVRRPAVVGCRRTGPSYRTNGSRGRKMVSLSFDDGPSAYTPALLHTLERDHAHATFFVIGDHIGGHEELLRRMLRDGDEIGNHTWNHSRGAGRGQLVATSERVHAATGFRPCLFRVPYGAASRGMISAAGSLHMTTIQWDVDPRDWSRPGAGAIYGRVVGAAHSGSIVVMHDGGGPRGQTLAALPHIIRTLRHRGYRLVTISRLLGNRPILG